MRSRCGAALIIAMIFVIFVVVTATYFLSTMSTYRGAGTQKVRFLLADAAIESGRAHAIRVLQEHALEADPALVGDPSLSSSQLERQMDIYTTLASNWRREFQRDRSLEPGNAWPDVATQGPPQENVASAGETFSWSNGTRNWSSLFDDTMLMPYVKVFNQGYAGRDDTRTINRGHGARYFNVGWFDDEFQPVPASERDEARYKLRYAVQIFDIGGLIKTNFYPETSYHIDDLNRDVPVSELGLQPGVVAEPWGSGNAGDLRREFDMLRDRYAMALFSMHGSAHQAARTWSGWKDSADVAFDRWLRHDPHVKLDREAFISKPGLKGPRYYAARPNGWKRIEDVQKHEYQWRLHKYRGLMAYYTGDESGSHPTSHYGEVFNPRRYINPGPKSSFELNAELLLPGSAVQHGAMKLRYSHIGEGLSRRRGDDVDTQHYWNILTMHNAEVLRVTHNWCSWLQYAWDRDLTDGDRNPLPPTAKGFAKASNHPFSTLPPAEGVPLDKDDNYGVTNADLGYAETDKMYDKSYDDSGAGYYPMHEVVRHGDINGDGNPEFHVAVDPDAPGHRPRFAHDAWYERAYQLRRHFYGLSGAEGKGLGPRMRRAGGRMTDYNDGGLSVHALNRHIQSQDYPYMAAAALHDTDGGRILVQDHYAWDLADALNMVIKATRSIWTATDNGKPDKAQHQVHWDKRVADRARIRDIHAVHRLFLNMLGEDVSTTGPWSGAERPEHWIAQPGALAGRTVTRFAGDTSTRGDNNWYLCLYYGRGDRFEAVDDHPTMIRVAYGANTAGMERLLNDVRISFFGASYVDERGVTQPIPPLDFNGDGFAESSLTGFNDGLVPRPSSYVHGTSQPRPYSSLATDGENPYHPFLAAAPGMPLKPFTGVGRLFMGKSHYYRVSVRGQLWDFSVQKKAAERTLDFIYCVNPSDHAATIQLEGPLKDGRPDLSDSHVIYQRMLINQARDGQGGN